MALDLPHITVESDPKHGAIVTVDDTELFHHVDDYLIEECDVDYEYMSTHKGTKNGIYKMYFSHEYTVEILEQHLSKLSASEVERIYALNN